MTTMQIFTDEQLNFLKFTILVVDEFPKALRHTFKTMWDIVYGNRQGFQLWDDSAAVRNLFAATEGGRTKIPIHQSYNDWDCTSLFQATIFAQSFALPTSRGSYATLSDLYVKPRGVHDGSFHTCVVSPFGNTAETFALAIDQLRKLRNSISHAAILELDSPTFEQYLNYAKAAFQALGVPTASIDEFARVTEYNNPPSYQRQNLTQRIHDMSQWFIEFLREVPASMRSVINVLTQQVEVDNASKEDISRLGKKIDELKVGRDEDDNLPENLVPAGILTQGPVALRAYKEALAHGETTLRRVPLMLIGQGGAGKTSTKKSLKGIRFDPEEESTVGVDVDPSCFKVLTETWCPGEQDLDKAFSPDYHLARCMANFLITPGETTQLNTVAEVGSNSFDSKVAQKEEGALRHQELIQESHKLSPSTVPKELLNVTSQFLSNDKVNDNREEIYFIFWDFAGQSVYYETHPLFLTERAIFFLVYDLSLNPDDEAKPVLKQGVYNESEESYNLKTNFDYLDFWMRSVASLGPSNEREGSSEESLPGLLPKKLPPVFLVCTHADKPYDHGNPDKLARKIFGFLRRKPYGSHLRQVFCVDNTSLSVEGSVCPEIRRLQQEIIAVANELPFIDETIPINWLKFEKALQARKEMGNKRMSLDSAKYIAKNDCNVVDKEEFKTLMNYLHGIRSLIHFEDTVELSKLVVLDPQWLVDVFKKVITVKPYVPEEEGYLHLWDMLETKGVVDEKFVAHVWGPLFEDKETLESLIGIMERFSLLCPWSVNASSNSQYLVPSMLKAYPSADILELVKSSSIPSLFVKFLNGQVPPTFFPRMVVQFIQWGRDWFWSEETPQLFKGFARFYMSKGTCSVIFVCHASFVEVVVHGGNSAHCPLSSEEVICAGQVCRQLSLILECMRNQFPWLRNMRYERCVICPVCSKGREVRRCRTHGGEICKQEQCLHFWTVSELCSNARNISCKRSPVARCTTVQTEQFSPWFPAPRQQLGTDECDEDPFTLGEGNQEKALAVCSSAVLQHLSSESGDAKLVVSSLLETIQLDQASLEEPDSKAKKRIRCLAREASDCGRHDVLHYLREIAPAGTTVAGGDKWKLVAEKLGLNHEEIRFLDERNTNPVDALLGFIANQRYMSVGELYQVLCDCGIPVIADKL